MTPGEWAGCCAELARLWPRQPLPVDTAEAWYRLLADLDARQVLAAIRALRLDPAREFAPGPGDIRQAAEPDPAGWEDALADLRSLVQRHGFYATLDGQERPHADDPALDRVIGQYGWSGVCRLDLHDPTVRAQFRDSYRAAHRRLVSDRRRTLAVDSTTDDRRGLEATTDG